MAITFHKISTYEPVTAYLCLRISRHLSTGKKVLWLVTGGSSIPMAAEVSRRLAGPQLKNLTVTLTDERYGPVGHPDSNWQQLIEAGFSLDGANLQPVISGKNFERTVDDYAQIIRRDLAENDYKIGFIGIGADGHAGGIKSGSPAVNSRELVEGYNSEDYVRLTLTPRAIARLDEVVAYAVGAAKHQLLDQLQQNLPINQQPAQTLKRAKKFTVYNDYIGDEV